MLKTLETKREEGVIREDSRALQSIYCDSYLGSVATQCLNIVESSQPVYSGIIPGRLTSLLHVLLATELPTRSCAKRKS